MDGREHITGDPKRARSRADREAERDRLTREALTSADAGRLIDHERVEEWLDGLGSPEAKPLPHP